MLRQPSFLKKGDTIGIVCTARKISKEELQPAISLYESWGLQVQLGDTIGEEENQYGGTDKARATDFQQMMTDKNIKAIICARGGYGTVRMMDYLDFTPFSQNPKWVVGFSDITVLHAHINTYIGTQTLHAAMPSTIPTSTEDTIDSLQSALFGEKYSIEAPLHKFNRVGEAEGIVVGGNLSLLYAILGTKSGINTDDKILFIEDLDEYLYHIDRMMIALKRAGKLNKLKALVVGGMTDMNDNTIPFGKSAEEIIAEHVAEFDYPVCYGFPSGHGEDNRSLIFGKKCRLSVDVERVELQF
ncbi:MAG: S66 peptidase family protein [Chitinophagales bacterium]